MLTLRINRQLVPKVEDANGVEWGTYQISEEWHLQGQSIKSLNDTMFEVITLYIDHADCVLQQLDDLHL